MGQLRRPPTAHPGDRGQTRMGSGMMVDKDSMPIETIGAIEELRAWISVLLSLSGSPQLQGLRAAQDDLSVLVDQIGKPGTTLLSQQSLDGIDAAVERLEADLAANGANAIIGALPTSAFAQLAHAVCRRAERRLFELSRFNTIVDTLLMSEGEGEADTGDDLALAYLNRLSDLLHLIGARGAPQPIPVAIAGDDQ